MHIGTHRADFGLTQAGIPVRHDPVARVPDGFIDNMDDCDDLEATVNPEASEVCDEMDKCKGITRDKTKFTLRLGDTLFDKEDTETWLKK